MPEALVAFGGNVGDVRETLRCAVDAFCDGRDVQLNVSAEEIAQARRLG